MRTHYDRAQEALSANNPEAAAREFNEIIRLDPRNAEAHASLGVIAFKQDDYSKASHEFEIALKLKPALWNAEAFLGLSQVRIGKQTEGRTRLERAFPHIQEKTLRIRVGSELVSILKQSGEITKAVSTLEALERSEPGDPEVLYEAYRTYSDLAARSLGNLADSAPGSARMHEILAQTLMSRDNFPGAIQEYSAALRMDPVLPEIHFELGQAILANSLDGASRAQAGKEFEAALAANPADADSEYELGEIALLNSDWQTAGRHYSRALELHPHFVNAQLGLGKVFIAQDQPKEALPYLLDAEHSDVRNESIHYQLASVYRKMGLPGEANREWSEFQELRKSKDTVRTLLQEVLQKAQQP